MAIIQSEQMIHQMFANELILNPHKKKIQERTGNSVNKLCGASEKKKFAFFISGFLNSSLHQDLFTYALSVKTNFAKARLPVRNQNSNDLLTLNTSVFGNSLSVDSAVRKSIARATATELHVHFLYFIIKCNERSKQFANAA